MRFVEVPLRANRFRLDEGSVAVENRDRVRAAERILRLERGVRGAELLDLNGILHAAPENLTDSRIVLRGDDDDDPFVAPILRRIDNVPN